MVSAVVLLKVSRGRVNQVAEQLVGLEGVREVYSVGGRYDLVAILRVMDNDSLAELVTEHMLLVDGIEDSETLVAFKAYWRQDLESMFSLGFES